MLEYRAPNACPPREEFLASLRRTARGLREASQGEDAREFVVVIEARGSAFDGSLRIRRGTNETSRSLTAATCTEIVRALVLVAKLALDPRLADAAESATSGEAPSDAGQSAPSQPSGAEPPNSKPPASAASSDIGATIYERPPSPGEAALRVVLHGNVGAGFMGAAAPAALWLVHAGTELAWASQERAYSPAVRLGVEYATRGGFAVEGGRGHFLYVGGNVELCPLGWRSTPLVVRWCAALDVGGLRSWSSSVPDARSAWRPWVDVGPGARLGWVLGQVRLEAGLSWIFPLVRDRYLVAEQPFYRTAASGMKGGLELGYQFL